MARFFSPLDMTVKELLNRFKEIDLVQVAIVVIDEYAPDVEMLNRQQLYDGLDQDGRYLSPRYSEDPFFKSSEDAFRYAEWKQQITPNPNRPFDVPNLFINGQFHYSRQLRIVDKRLVFESDDHNSPDIVRKYKNIDGLTPKSVLWFRENELYPDMLQKLAEKTGLKTIKT